MIGTGRVALSRAVHLLKAANKCNKLTTIRNSGHSVQYRLGPADPPLKATRLAEALGGLFWWWVLWHLFTEPGHIYGEFPYPDPAKWTDEELGVE